MKIHALLLSTILISMSSCGGGKDSSSPASDPTPSSSSRSIASSTAATSSSIASSADATSSSVASSTTITSSSVASSSSSLVASSSSTSSQTTPCATKECESHNKDLVLKIYTDIMNDGKIDVVNSVFDTNLIIHIPGSNNGPTGEISHLQTLKNNNPNYVATVKHIAGDGDYVAVHWHLSTTPNNEFNGKAVVDLYKLSGDKITEHWHLSENLSANTVSGNSLFSNLYLYPGAKPVATQESEAANKLLVTSTYLGLFNDKNLSLINQNIDSYYIQHNPYVPDGREPFRNFVSSRAAGGLSFFATVSDDDLVWTFSGTSSLTLVDIFRVDNKKIVEHYDVF